VTELGHGLAICARNIEIILVRGALAAQEPGCRGMKWYVRVIERAAERCAEIADTTFIAGSPRSYSHFTFASEELK
jgi:hypothetical protein